MMKPRRAIVLLGAAALWAALVLLSACRSAPQALPEESPAPEVVVEIEETPETFSFPEIDEEAWEEALHDLQFEYERPEAVSIASPPEEETPIELPEPLLDLPEVFAAALLPEEAALPALPALPEPPAPAPPSPAPPSSAQTAAKETAPQTPPEPPAQAPPAPPAFLGPAAPKVPAPAREPPPVPVNPLPELPAAAPPVPIPAEDETITFSRTVRAVAGQLVEIPFRGTGWVYLGELASRRGISYESRRLDPEGQSFIFRTETPETYALKFYKQDFIRDYILNDYVQVIVEEAPDTAGLGWSRPPVDRSRVIASPRWPLLPGEAGPPREDSPTDLTENTDEDAGKPSVGSADNISASQAPPQQGAPLPGPALPGEGTALPAAGEPAPQGAPQSAETAPKDYIARAREEFNAGRTAGALAALEEFSRRYPSGSDEAWWLYGQILEASSPQRNIRLALEYYRRILREYPQSKRAEDAKKRIAYLERYYFNIR